MAATEGASGIGWWARSLGVGAGIGLAVGLLVGGTLGRVFMRLVFLAREDTRGFETAMGAIIGDFTGGGTFFIGVFGAFFGLGLGLAYAAVRVLMPSPLRWRLALFGLATTALMLGQIVRGNREDFTILPVTLSLVLIAGSVALTALPVPVLVERLAPDRARNPGVVSYAVVGIGLAAAAAYAVTGITLAYDA